MDEFEYFGLEAAAMQAEAEAYAEAEYAQQQAEAEYNYEQEQREFEITQANLMLDKINDEIENLRERILELQEKKQEILSSIKS